MRPGMSQHSTWDPALTEMELSYPQAYLEGPILGSAWVQNSGTELNTVLIVASTGSERPACTISADRHWGNVQLQLGVLEKGIAAF